MDVELPEGFTIVPEYEDFAPPGQQPKFLGFALYRGPERIGRFATVKLATAKAAGIVAAEKAREKGHGADDEPGDQPKGPGL